jgi:hypothetical protein
MVVVLYKITVFLPKKSNRPLGFIDRVVNSNYVFFTMGMGSGRYAGY